jgi:acetylornithine deacetylase
VIEAGPLERWTDPPFDAVVRDGRVIGRGAADMKGGLAAAIGAVRALKSLGLSPASDLAIQCVMGEETGGLGTIAAVRQGQPVGAAIAIEPTGLTLAPAQSGHLKFTLVVDGRNAHTAVPWTGVSAFEKLTYIYDGLKQLSSERNQRVRHLLFDAWPNKAPFAVGLVHAGHYGWTIPDHAEARGRFGILPGEEPDAARSEVEKRLAELSADDPWLREHPARIQWMFGTFPAWETPGNDPLISSLRGALDTVSGSSVERGMTYGCDSCHIHRLTGAPVAIFGPGVIEDCHIPNESIAIADVLTAAKVLALTALQWKGASDGTH